MARKLSPAELAKAIEDAGGLIGANRSAAALGVAPPNLKRHKAKLTKIPVEGSADVYVRAEVEGLADELDKSRREREG